MTITLAQPSCRNEPVYDDHAAVNCDRSPLFGESISARGLQIVAMLNKIFDELPTDSILEASEIPAHAR